MDGSMQQEIPIRRLMERGATSQVLQRFASSVRGAMTVAILNGDGRVYAISGEDPALQLSEEPAWSFRLPLMVDARRLGTLVASGDALEEPRTEPMLQLFHQLLSWLLLKAVENRSLAQETLERYREINLLYKIGETIGASLDVDRIPELMIDEAGRIIQADGGVVLLYAASGEGLSVGAGFGADAVRNQLRANVELEANLAKLEETSHIWAADQLTQRGESLGSLLVAPLKGRERVWGFVTLGRTQGRDVFSADDEKLLVALTSQAAIAIDNAHLFANVRDQRDAMAEMTTFMDNVFSSIASGVLTTDMQDRITLINRAAEHMLGVREEDVVGRSILSLEPDLSRSLGSLVRRVRMEGESIIGQEIELTVPDRGAVVLRLSLSPLQDNRGEIAGLTLVVDDLTEQRKLEARARRIRRTFEQYVAPQVVERLLSDPDTARLGGISREVTTLFADIRGFTTFSEQQRPEMLVEVLNRYLTLAADVILSVEGTLDKFYGDGVMAVFNAPLHQPDHTLRAVKAALGIQSAVSTLHPELPEPHRLKFGIGITTGITVIGSIGSTKMKNYTAIGDCVNLASRLQRSAAPGQILLSQDAYQRVEPYVKGRDLGITQIRGHIEPVRIFEIQSLT